MKTLEQLSEISRSIAWSASDILQSYYRQDSHTPNLDIQEKKDGPVTAADIAVNSYILDELQSALGNAEFGYLSEETYKSYLETNGQIAGFGAKYSGRFIYSNQPQSPGRSL